MGKEKNAILTKKDVKSKIPVVIATIATIAIVVAVYYIWLHPSDNAEAENGESSEPLYSSYEDCLMKTQSATTCAKFFYNK